MPHLSGSWRNPLRGLGEEEFNLPVDWITMSSPQRLRSKQSSSAATNAIPPSNLESGIQSG